MSSFVLLRDQTESRDYRRKYRPLARLRGKFLLLQHHNLRRRGEENRINSTLFDFPPGHVECSDISTALYEIKTDAYNRTVVKFGLY